MTTKTHDSNSCEEGTGGEPCEMCQFANEQEKAQLSQSTYESLRDSVLERVHAAMADDCDCPEHQTAAKDGERLDRTAAKNIISEMRQDQTFASLTTIRSAVFDVIDGGCTCESGEKHPWELDDDPNDSEQTEEIVNQQRGRFVDAVCRRILQLQHPPHGMDAGLREALNEDLNEMRRLAMDRRLRNDD